MRGGVSPSASGDYEAFRRAFVAAGFSAAFFSAVCLPVIGISLYATPAIIIVAYLSRFATLAIKAPIAAIRQMPRDLEEAARSCGAAPPDAETEPDSPGAQRAGRASERKGAGAGHGVHLVTGRLWDGVPVLRDGTGRAPAHCR